MFSKFIENFTGEINQYFDRLLKFLPQFGISLFVFFIGLYLAIHISSFIKDKLKRRIRDVLMLDFLGQFMRWTLIVIVLALTLKIMGLGGIASSLIAGAGITAFVIGFAFKDIGENFLSGIILAFKRPFRIGDTIESSAIKGSVQGLDLRVTHIKMQDGTDVYIPNSMIVKNPLFNYTRGGAIRNSFNIAINYWNDFEKARSVITRAIGSTQGISKRKTPSVTIDALTKDGMDLKVYYWVDLADYEGDLLFLKGVVQNNVKCSLLDSGFLMPVPSPMPSGETSEEKKEKVRT